MNCFGLADLGHMLRLRQTIINCLKTSCDVVQQDDYVVQREMTAEFLQKHGNDQ